jgi:hypothetical protein
MMKISKICANATYHKVMKDLHNYGFIRYKPSYNPFRGSEVELLKLEAEPVQEPNRHRTNGSTKTEQELNSYNSKNRTSTEPINEPYINNTNSINSKHRESTHTSSKNELIKKPSVEEVRRFFLQQKSSEVEAEKFFNHFQSNGWLVGGRAPMKDWKAAAKKWMLNNLSSTTVKSTSRLQLNGQNKNYSEPL